MRREKPNPDQLPDLVKRIYAGDSRARETLLAWCLERIYQKVKTELQRFGEDVWWDVTQEIIFDLLRFLARKKFDPDSGNLPALIHGFVKTEITAFLSKTFKKRSRQSLSELNRDEMADKKLIEKLQFDFYSLNRETNRIESLFEICLKKLPAKLAEVLALRYWNDLSMRKIAEQMGLSHQQKAIDMHRQALKDLSRCVKQYYKQF